MQAADPAVICESSKLKVAGKYEDCRLKAESKAVKKGTSPDYSKCVLKFSDKWQKSETKAGPGLCPSEGDEGSLEDFITRHAGAIADALSGQLLLDPYFPATGQTVSYGPGDDGYVQAGAVQAFVDNLDGTITDTNTGLMWEKKRKRDAVYTDCSATEAGACADPHDADNLYDWSDGPCCPETDYDGGAVTVFLEQLNNRCNNDTTVSCTVDADCTVPGGPCGFAGHRDWRLPNVNELLSIIDRGTFDPALNPAFHGASCGVGCVDLADPACSCGASDRYWSASTIAGGPDYAWIVYTYFGSTNFDVKTNLNFVRAVRSGS